MAKKRVLFVCYANQHRSPTAERVFKEMAIKLGYGVEDYSFGKRPKYDFKVSSAGVDIGEGRNWGKESNKLEEQFDLIFALDKGVATTLVEKCDVPQNRIINLNILDIYKKDDPELIEILKQKLEPYLKI